MPWHLSEGIGGGAEVQAWYLATNLADQGVQVSYICQTREKKRIGTKEVIQNVQVLWLPKNGKFEWLGLKKYHSALNALKPKVVIQRMSSCVSYPIARYCKDYNAKFVWMCTDNASCFKWMLSKRQRTENIKQKIPFIKAAFFQVNAIINDLLRHRGMTYVDLAMHQNQFQKKHIFNAFKKVSVQIRSGHPAPSERISTEKRLEKPIVIWIGNIGHRKYPERFLKLATQMLESPFEFIMVGGTSNNKYINQLQKQKPDNVKMTGKLRLTETEALLKHAFAYVNTSRNVGEGFPNTFIQAWMRGVPVFSFQVNPDDIITTHKLGYVTNSIEEMSKHLSQTYADKKQYHETTLRVEKYATRYHNIHSVSKQLLSDIKQSGGKL